MKIGAVRAKDLIRPDTIRGRGRVNARCSAALVRRVCSYIIVSDGVARDKPCRRSLSVLESSSLVRHLTEGVVCDLRGDGGGQGRICQVRGYSPRQNRRVLGDKITNQCILDRYVIVCVCRRLKSVDMHSFPPGDIRGIDPGKRLTRPDSCDRILATR